MLSSLNSEENLAQTTRRHIEEYIRMKEQENDLEPVAYTEELMTIFVTQVFRYQESGCTMQESLEKLFTGVDHLFFIGLQQLLAKSIDNQSIYKETIYED